MGRSRSLDPRLEEAWRLARSRPLSEAIDTLAGEFGLPRSEASSLIWQELHEPAPRPAASRPLWPDWAYR